MKKVFLPLIASCRANRSLPSELAVGHLTPKAVKQDQSLTFLHENKAYEQEVWVNVLKHLLTCWNLLVWLLLKKGPSGLLLIVMASNRTIHLCDFTSFLSDFFCFIMADPKVFASFLLSLYSTGLRVLLWYKWVLSQQKLKNTTLWSSNSPGGTQLRNTDSYHNISHPRFLKAFQWSWKFDAGDT